MKWLPRALAPMLPLLLLMLLRPAWAVEEDGYDLWLRYRPLEKTAQAQLRARATALVYAGGRGAIGATGEAAVAELRRGLEGMLGAAPALGASVKDGAIVLGTPATLPEAAALDLAPLGKEGYLVRSMRLRGHRVTLIAANSDIGLLYGAFAWLRAASTGAGVDFARELRSAPRLQLRVLNHWDNLNRTVERGYAGESIWNWWALPEIRDRRHVDYGRANASLGINGTVLNNVNSKPDILTAPWIAKAAAVADTLRPYGIKVYLSARFSTPLELGATKTADPLDPAVAAWWRAKADEIYKSIPDFGGFLVKANSEGQPGPQDYKRSHADGANMLAAALAPHQGVVMWRAFVYAHEKPDDRAKQAYDEFKPLDGTFAPNVLVQVKNGAIDFQPREPAHPLFGAMPNTPLMMEFQITKEYLGFATHTAYLGTMYEETLATDMGNGNGTVARILERGAGPKDQPRSLTGMAGVANIGSDRTWSGSHFDQANWYAYGRLAWDPRAGAREIAREWVAQTFSPDPRVTAPVVDLLMMSREAVVNYMTPLGLHHLMGTGHHHGPAPWVDDLGRPDWNPVYYHRAGRDGVGFDRTATGSDAVAQYAPELARRYADPRATPEPLLLWFHHLPWDYRMASGRTLWTELVARYDLGVAQAEDMRGRWLRLKPAIDARRHAEVLMALDKQLLEARWWRDACVAYFQSVSGLPLPAGAPAPERSLDHYKSLRFPYAPGNG
ncbi:alpha-glucuronidase family glycosyl hydrolase [Pseudoduganella namucuonensis]|uniref:Xylan alpha-1,2-glucuronidase n=1 Tax=Pseudoduganella namucuonensis TaxID=1035707 RepID=A0A1I7FN09_9BURK|nr:alpha-glucuronidase family glycosyl hydrolase [Pseudoduganella namucuonensis]SFU37564.1 alpha-glucuronidase [Pseudoduganella namucuonensis]